MLKRRKPKRMAAKVMYPLLFDRFALADFPPTADGPPTSEPWRSFDLARRELAEGNRDDAVAIWRRIAETDGAEARVVLQAWRFLRTHGVAPPGGLAHTVLGAVAELPLDGTHDVMAAYADGSARLLSHGGDAVVYQGGDEIIDVLVQANIELAQQMADRLGTWGEEADLPAVARGHGRVLAMTLGGIRFGQGPIAQLEQDPMAGEVLAGARLLAYELVRRSLPGAARDFPQMVFKSD